MFESYLKIAWRSLLRNKIYSFINVFGLSLGLTAAMLILLYSKDEVSYDRFHNNNPNIYRVVFQSVNPDGSIKHQDGNTGHFQGPKFKESIAGIRNFVRLKSDFRNIRQNTGIMSEEMLVADSSFFTVFSFPLLSGDPATALKNPNSLVISEEMAEKYFNTKDVLGKTLEINGNDGFAPYQITGVARKCPQNSSIKFQFLLPNIVSPKEFENSDNWFNIFQNTFVLLDPAATRSQVESQMKQVFETDSREAYTRLKEQFGMQETWQFLLQPMTDMHLSTEFKATNGLQDASNPMFSYLLGGIAVFILIIASINFVNLTVARSVKRAREIGVRKVVGSDRKQLIIQFMSESFLLCLASFLVALLLVQLVMPQFNYLANKVLSLSYLFDYKLIIFYVALFLVTGFLSGFYPALVLSGFSPVSTLYGRFMLSGKNYLQKSLVVLQFGLASFLIISTLTIFYQFNFLTTKDLGYDDTDLIMVEKWDMSRQQAHLFRNQLLSNPNIVDAAPKNGGFWGTVARINGDEQMNFAYETVDTRFLPMMKIRLLEGRNFSSDFPSDSTGSVLVNESFVKAAGWVNPIGQEVNFWYDNNARYQVIGVVQDHHFTSVNQSIEPQLFTMKPGNNYGMMYIKIKPGAEVMALKHIEATFKSLFPLNSYSYKFKEAENLKNYESEAKWKQIMLLGAILTIFVSCIGLFGLATLSAEKRMKEIGIRKVLGATVSSIVALLSKDFLKLVLISFLVSFPAAWLAANKWLENYPYRENFNFMILVATASITLLVAFFTVSWHSFKTALMNPVKSLKNE